jgi:hypothetical protein
MLHVSAAQGHLQATHFLRSLLHNALGQIVLLRRVVVINFDDVGWFLAIVCIAAVSAMMSLMLSLRI